MAKKKQKERKRKKKKEKKLVSIPFFSKLKAGIGYEEIIKEFKGLFSGDPSVGFIIFLFSLGFSFLITVANSKRLQPDQPSFYLELAICFLVFFAFSIPMISLIFLRFKPFSYTHKTIVMYEEDGNISLCKREKGDRVSFRTKIKDVFKKRDYFYYLEDFRLELVRIRIFEKLPVYLIVKFIKFEINDAQVLHERWQHKKWDDFLAETRKLVENWLAEAGERVYKEEDGLLAFSDTDSEDKEDEIGIVNLNIAFSKILKGIEIDGLEVINYGDIVMEVERLSNKPIIISV